VLLPPIRAAYESAKRDADARAGFTAVVEGGVTYRSLNGGYSVQMFGRPTVQTSAGNLAVWEMAIAESKDGTFCAAAHAKRPASMSDVSRYLELGLTSMKQTLDDVQVLSDLQIAVEGHAGREVEFTGKSFGRPFWSIGRMIVTDKMAYKLLWTEPQGQKTQKDGRRFLDSFELTQTGQ